MTHELFIVLLRFSTNRSQGGQYLTGHREWIRRGRADGTFLVVGTLQPNAGGVILAYGTTLADLTARVEEDPFVAADVVRPEILAITPSHVDEQLAFLMPASTEPEDRR